MKISLKSLETTTYNGTFLGICQNLPDVSFDGCNKNKNKSKNERYIYFFWNFKQKERPVGQVIVSFLLW